MDYEIWLRLSPGFKYVKFCATNTSDGFALEAVALRIVEARRF
jgi:hypothetical protein